MFPNIRGCSSQMQQHSKVRSPTVKSAEPCCWSSAWLMLSIPKARIAGNELSYLQQIQGGQQIGEETSASNVRGSHEFQGEINLPIAD